MKVLATELNNFTQDIGEPCIHLKIHKTDPVTEETTPITFSLSGDKFRLLLRGKSFCTYYIALVCMTVPVVYTSVFNALDMKQVHTMMENLS